MPRSEIGKPDPPVCDLGIFFVFALLEKGFGTASSSVVCLVRFIFELIIKQFVWRFLLKPHFLLVGVN